MTCPSSCKARCCTYVCTQVSSPKADDDWGGYGWMADHAGVTLAVDREGQWFLWMDTRCKHLSALNRCSIYGSRPAVCRNHDPKTCEHNGTGPDEFIAKLTSSREVSEYREQQHRLEREQGRRKRLHKKRIGDRA